MASIPPLTKRAFPYLVILLGVLAVRFQALQYLTTRYIGGTDGDAGLYVWLVKSFVSNPWQALNFESNAFFPYSLSRAWSDNFLLPSLLAAIFQILGAGEPLAYNLVILAATFLNGALTFKLCKTLKAGTLSSLLAGIGFMSTSYLTGHLGHPQLQFAFFIPLGASLLLKSQTSSRCWLYFGLTLSAAFYTTVYYSIFISLFLLCAAAYSVFNSQISQSVRNFSLLLLGSLPIAWALPTYLAVKEAFSERGLFEAFYFSATAYSYISHPQFSRFYSDTQILSHSEAQLGCGMVLLALALAAFWKAYGKTAIGRTVSILMLSCIVTAFGDVGLRPIVAIASWLALLIAPFAIRAEKCERNKMLGMVAWFAFLFFSLSLGPLGNPNKGDLAFGVFSLLHSLLPGVDAIRAVGRFGIVTLLGFYVLAALWLTNRRSVFVVVIFAVSILENLHIIFPLEESVPAPQVITSIPPDSVVLSIPMATEIVDRRVVRWGEFARLNVNVMNWFAGTSTKIVNGYSGQRSKLMLELPYAVQDFPSAASVKYLSQLPELNFVLVNSKLIPNFDSAHFEGAVKELSPAIEIIRQDDSGGILLAFRPTQSVSQASGVVISYLADSKRSFKVSESAASECALTVRCSLDQTIENASKVAPQTVRLSDSKEVSFVPSCPLRSLSVRPYLVGFDSTCSATISQ